MASPDPIKPMVRYDRDDLTGDTTWTLDLGPGFGPRPIVGFDLGEAAVTFHHPMGASSTVESVELVDAIREALADGAVPP